METIGDPNLNGFPTTATIDPSGSDSPPPKLNKPRHVKYWLRCLKTYLPTAYQSTDTQRHSLAFFIISALDLLDELENNITVEERSGYVDWVYRSQHPHGGFRGFVVGDVNEVKEWDSANLGTTFFALAILCLLGDDFKRVKRRECEVWLRSLQKEDGSFAETRSAGEAIRESQDVRLCYLAAGTRWFLRHAGTKSDGAGVFDAESVTDIDIDGVTNYIFRSATYEGGIAKAPPHEANAGETYCGIGALALLGRLPKSTSNGQDGFGSNPEQGDFSLERVTRWLVFRQTLRSHELCMDSEDSDQTTEVDASLNTKVPLISSFQGPIASAAPVSGSSHMGSSTCPSSSASAGFNGRCNKIADTCYAWWAGGCLAILGKSHLQNFNAVERYLLQETQHMIGGFSKSPGEPPDIMHSYLGLAALAAIRHPDLKRIEPSLCISVNALENLNLGNRG